MEYGNQSLSGSFKLDPDNIQAILGLGDTYKEKSEYDETYITASI